MDFSCSVANQKQATSKLTFIALTIAFPIFSSIMNLRINSAFPLNWFYFELGVTEGFIKKLIENYNLN